MDLYRNDINGGRGFSWADQGNFQPLSAAQTSPSQFCVEFLHYETGRIPAICKADGAQNSPRGIWIRDRRYDCLKIWYADGENVTAGSTGDLRHKDSIAA